MHLGRDTSNARVQLRCRPFGTREREEGELRGLRVRLRVLAGDHSQQRRLARAVDANKVPAGVLSDRPVNVFQHLSFDKEESESTAFDCESCD